MRKIYNATPTEGLCPINRNDPKYPNDGYIASKRFVMIELDRGEYLDFYLKPLGEGCLIIAHVDELELIDSLKEDKVELLKMMSSSDAMSEFIKNSISSSNTGVRLYKLPDFTEESSSEHVFCVGKHLNIKLTPKIFEDNSHEEKVVGNAIEELINIALEYYKFYDVYSADPRNQPWIRKSPLKSMRAMTKKMWDDNFIPSFVVQTDKLPSELNKYLAKNGYVLLTEIGAAYKLNYPVYKEELGQDVNFIIEEKMFYDEISGKHHAFWVTLSPQGSNRWEISIEMEGISKELYKFFDNFDLKESMIPNIFYENMPHLCAMWFYSNEKNKDKSIEDYLEIKDDKRSRSNSHRTSSKYRIEDNKLVRKDTVSFNFLSKEWGNIESLVEIIYQGIWLSYEIYIAEPTAKKYMKGRWLKIGTDLLKVVGKLSRYSS